MLPCSCTGGVANASRREQGKRGHQNIGGTSRARKEIRRDMTSAARADARRQRWTPRAERSRFSGQRGSWGASHTASAVRFRTSPPWCATCCGRHVGTTSHRRSSIALASPRATSRSSAVSCWANTPGDGFLSASALSHWVFHRMDSPGYCASHGTMEASTGRNPPPTTRAGETPATKSPRGFR